MNLMATTILNIDAIISDPTIRSGRPIIAGTGICVSDIVARSVSGDARVPEEIAEDFKLSLGEVYAALAYYHFHKEDIDREIRASESEAEELANILEAQEKLTRIE
jgi:uncharacterized protein (DUF433 family)